MRKSSKTALGGIIASLSLTLMLLSTVIPFLTYALPALAGVILTAMVIEIGRKWAFCAYIAISVLSLLILADKETAMMYVAFFGYYPIAKSIIEEKIQTKITGYILKLLIFNISIIAAYLVIIYLFKIPVDGMDDFGKFTVPILLLMGNVVFVLYDYVISRLVYLYVTRLRKYFRRIFK